MSDTAPDTKGASIIIDHAFIPRGQWWSLCKVCGLSEPAHRETTVETVETELGKD